MALTRITTTGRGRMQFRMVIEGFGLESVTSARMEKTTSDGRVRRNGLNLSDVSWGARASLMRAQVDASSWTATIQDMKRKPGSLRIGEVTEYFVRRPSRSGFLAGDIDPTDTTITLRAPASTVFPSSGVVHIGTEAIAYSGTSGNDLTGCTRGYWGSTAQGHFARDGEGLSDARVTVWPQSIEGRRVSYYAYSEGDDPQGDGTLFWQGVASTEAAWRDGVVTFGVDPMTRVLSQPIGGDLAGSVGVRGVKYSNASPFRITVASYPASSDEVQSTVDVVGYWETNELFAAAVTTALNDALTAGSISLGTDASLTARARGDSLEISYITATSSPPNIAVYINDGFIHALNRTSAITAPTTSPVDWYDSSSNPVTRMGDREWSPAVSSRYHIVISAPVPRGTLGVLAAWDPYARVPGSAGLGSIEWLLPLGGLAVPTSDSVLLSQGSEWDEAWSDDPRPLRVYSASGRDATVLPTGRSIVAYTKATSFKMGRHLATGSVVDLVVQLFATSPEIANSGACPLILPADIVWTNEVDDAAESSRLANGRGFYVFDDGHTLGDYVVPELLALGCYQRLGSTGAIEWDRLRAPLSTDDVTWQIDESATAWELQKAPDGTLGMVLYRTGYSPKDDEHSDRTIAFRDVQSASSTRTPITMEIAQLSTVGGISPSDTWTVIDRDELARVAMDAFGLFGASVTVVGFQTDARYMDVRIGDAVSVTSRMLPDPADGYSPLDGRAGMVIAHSFAPMPSGRVAMAVMLTDESFAGYNLGVPVRSPTDLGSDEWSITVTLTDYLFAPAGSPTIASVIEVGDLVRIVQGDSSTPTTIDGEVTAVTGSDEVTVQFVSTWTPGSDEWFLCARDSTNYDRDASLGRYAFVSEAGVIEFASAEDPSMVFA